MLDVFREQGTRHKGRRFKSASALQALVLDAHANHDRSSSIAWCLDQSGRTTVACQSDGGMAATVRQGVMRAHVESAVSVGVTLRCTDLKLLDGVA